MQQKDLGKTDVDGEKSDPASRLVPSAMEEVGKSVIMNVVGGKSDRVSAGRKLWAVKI